MKQRFLIFFLLLLTLPFIGLGCKSNVKMKAVALDVWGVFDDESDFAPLIAAYRQAHPNITIKYRKFRYEEYEQELLNALAEDRGPDIFSIHNTWLGKYKTKIEPMPATITLPYQFMRGTIKKELITEMRTTASIKPASIRQSFIDVVGGDVIRTDVGTDEERKLNPEQVIGLPLSVDTLVMFYNQDLLNRADIALPPEDWKTFVADVAKITRVNDKGEIIVAGAALGTAENIPRFSDILAVLMMQNGAVMANKDGYPTFNAIPTQYAKEKVVPGVDAIIFYTDFANPNKQAYTWNKDMADALEEFTSGRVAFFFGYSYHIPQIKTRSPQLRWNIAPIPQTDAENNKVNFANYWVETVSKKTKFTNEAWDFIQFAASKQGASIYLKAAQKPTALKALIDEQKNDPVIAPFASSLLTAKSWYRGLDAGRAEEALAELVEQFPMVWTAEEPEGIIGRLISNAVGKISQTIR